jgi:hypothetical protein
MSGRKVPCKPPKPLAHDIALENWFDVKIGQISRENPEFFVKQGVKLELHTDSSVTELWTETRDSGSA